VRNQRPLGAAAGLFVTAVGVCGAGCARPEKTGPATATLRIGVSLPAGQTTSTGLRTLIPLLTTEPLLTNELDGRQAERLAQDWIWDQSRTKLQLKLRRDVLFHDGTPLSAEVVAQALRARIAAHSESSFASVASISVTGDDTITLQLTEPDSFFLPDLALISISVPGKPDIGTGPFTLASQSGQQTILRRFDKFYRGRPAIEVVEIDAYPSQRKAWASMMRGSLDMLYEVSRDAVEFVEAESAIKTYTFPRAYYIPLVFNVRHPVLKNAQVRRAINQALDKEALVKEGLRGRGRPADGPIWPDHWAYIAARQPTAFNPDAARLRLDTAGYPIRPATRGEMPSRFSFTCLVWAEDARFERLALVLQKQFADIGIDMRLDPLGAAAFDERARSGRFDALLIEMAGRSLSWVYRFWHSPSGQALLNSGYDRADAALERIRRARSDEEVRSGVADLVRVFTEDPPAAFLAWQSQSRAVSAQFDVLAEHNRDVLSNLWQSRPAGAR
jgi:peptide/nickel transport system substrate-binding protein